MNECICDQQDILVAHYDEHYATCPLFEKPLTHAERR